MCLPVCPAAFQRKAFPKTLKDFCLPFPDSMLNKSPRAKFLSIVKTESAMSMDLCHWASEGGSFPALRENIRPQGPASCSMTHSLLDTLIQHCAPASLIPSRIRPVVIGAIHAFPEAVIPPRARAPPRQLRGARCTRCCFSRARSRGGRVWRDRRTSP